MGDCTEADWRSRGLLAGRRRAEQVGCGRRRGCRSEEEAVAAVLEGLGWIWCLGVGFELRYFVERLVGMKDLICSTVAMERARGRRCWLVLGGMRQGDA